MSRFDDTVSALVYTLLGERIPEERREDRFLDNRVVRFVIEQHARMPDVLRRPLRVATLAFDAWPIPTTGRCFRRLAPDRRQRHVARWRASHIGARHDLVRFYESLAVFGWYSLRDED